MKSYERKEKVARAIQKELGSFIQQGGVKDDRLNGLISIVEVSMNSSLNSAKVTYSVMSANEDEELVKINTQAALNDNAGFLRGLIARRLNLKYAPRLFFVAGSSLSKAVDMVDLIERTVKDDKKKSSQD